jgi:folate-binding protein YgfZ
VSAPGQHPVEPFGLALPQSAALPVEFVVIRVEGKDAAEYLEGQLSAAVSLLATGDGTQALLLEPNGKLVAPLAVHRADDGTYLLATFAELADRCYERLTRYLIRVKVGLERQDVSGLLVFGTQATCPGVPSQGPSFDLSAGVISRWLVPDRGLPCPLVSREDYEIARVWAGAWGPEEIVKDVIAFEIDGLVDKAVSFTKGCYVGQELMARMDARGRRAARHLRRILGEVPLARRDQLYKDGKAVGTVTSAAAWGDYWVALAYVHRSVEPGDEVAAAGGPARVLPLY